MIAAARCTGAGKVAAARELVMILKEAHKSGLQRGFCAQVGANRDGSLLTQSIIQPLVVGPIEPLFQHPAFQIPVDLRHEVEFRVASSYVGDGARPEVLHAPAPRSLEDFWEQQHRHVAT